MKRIPLQQLLNEIESLQAIKIDPKEPGDISVSKMISMDGGSVFWLDFRYVRSTETWYLITAE